MRGRGLFWTLWQMLRLLTTKPDVLMPMFVQPWMFPPETFGPCVHPESCEA